MQYSNIQQVLTELDKKHITYLDFDSYNDDHQEDVRIDPDNNPLWDAVWDTLINPFLEQHHLDLNNTDLAVNFLAKENGKWYIEWYNPEIATTIDDMLDSSKPLDPAFTNYKAKDKQSNITVYTLVTSFSDNDQFDSYADVEVYADHELAKQALEEQRQATLSDFKDKGWEITISDFDDDHYDIQTDHQTEEAQISKRNIIIK